MNNYNKKYSREMNPSDIFLFLLYGVAFVFIVYLILIVIRRLNEPTTPNVIVVEQTPSYEDVWPWAYTGYNWWPYWLPFAGGYGAGYYMGRRWGPGHGQGGYRGHGGPGGRMGGAGRGGRGGGGRH